MRVESFFVETRRFPGTIAERQDLVRGERLHEVPLLINAASI